MVCFFLDNDTERTSRNLHYFMGKENILYVPISSFDQLNEHHYFADAAIIYYSSGMDTELLRGISMIVDVKIYFICSENKYTRDMLKLCSGVQIENKALETDMLYDFLMKEKKYINKNPKDKRTYIEKTFEAFTAPQHLYGIDYLKHAIEVCCSNKEMMQGVTKTLYPYIAAKYFTNSAAVEHAIRTAITHIWQEKEEDISRLLFLKRGEKPTNKTFICAFSRYINEKTQNY